MKQNTFKSTLALVAIAFLTACGSDELPADPSFDQDIKTELVDKSQLPEWLADYVSYLEYVPEGQEIPTEKSGIYRFELFKKLYYEVFSPDQGTIHSDLYTEDGIPVDIKQTYTPSFIDSTKNWTIVYMLNPTHDMPKDNIYPVISEWFDQYDSKVRDYLSFKENPNEFRLYDQFFFLVNTEKELKQLLGNSAKLPEIDFSSHTLIIGMADVEYGSSLDYQRIHIEDSVPTLQLYFKKKMFLNQKPTDTREAFFIWGVYPKLPYETIKLKSFWDNSEYSGRVCFCQKNIYSPNTEGELKWEVAVPIDSLGNNNSYIRLQIPGDGSITFETDSASYTGKIEIGELGIQEDYGLYGDLYGDMKITLNDISFPKETNPLILRLLQRIEDYTYFSASFYGFSLMSAKINKRYFFKLKPKTSPKVKQH
jgi:hypothetical protein